MQITELFLQKIKGSFHVLLWSTVFYMYGIITNHSVTGEVTKKTIKLRACYICFKPPTLR